MLYNIRINNKEQALKFINDILKDLGEEEVDEIEYSGEKIKVAPELRAEHVSEGPKDITIENYMTLNVIVGDLDFDTQEIVKKHENMLHRL